MLKYQTLEVKYCTGSDYNKCTSEILATKIKEKRSVDKSSGSNLVKNFDFNTKIVTLATKAELKAEQDKMVKLKHSIQVIFVVKVILKMMTHRII